MNILVRFTSRFFSGISVAVFAVSIVGAQDLLKVAPDKGKVLLENAQVRVIDFRVKAGGKVPMHSHPAHFVYAFNSGKAKFTDPTGKSVVRDLKAGQVIWNDPVTHSTENLTDAHVLIVELKAVAKK